MQFAIDLFEFLFELLFTTILVILSVAALAMFGWIWPIWWLICKSFELIPDRLSPLALVLILPWAALTPLAGISMMAIFALSEAREAYARLFEDLTWLLKRVPIIRQPIKPKLHECENRLRTEWRSDDRVGRQRNHQRMNPRETNLRNTPREYLPLHGNASDVDTSQIVQQAGKRKVSRRILVQVMRADPVTNVDLTYLPIAGPSDSKYVAHPASGNGPVVLSCLLSTTNAMLEK